MDSRRVTHPGVLIVLASVALIAAACGNGAAPTASPASPAAAATPSAAASASSAAAETPAATASSAAAGSPGADPAASLSIAAPYTFAPLEGAQAGQIDQVRNSLGAMSAVVQMGVRQVKKSGANDGLLMAMAFPGVPVPGSFLDTFAASAGGANATVTSRTIEGQDVKLIEGASTHVAAYAHGSTMVFAYGQTADETVAIITAVIQASE
jgi:hypothetical protein